MDTIQVQGWIQSRYRDGYNPGTGMGFCFLKTLFPSNIFPRCLVCFHGVQKKMYSMNWEKLMMFKENKGIFWLKVSKMI